MLVPPANPVCDRRGAPGERGPSSIGFGWMLIAAAGAGLVAAGMGWSPFGRSED